MSKYSEKLKDPRWQKKRLEIFERDKWACQACKRTERTLAVHHKYYENNVDPWNYQESSLITLCEDCHQVEYEFREQLEDILTYKLKKLGYSVDALIELISEIESRGEIEWKLIFNGGCGKPVDKNE